jgi:photosystem II stability/assembly factor-like uncharacterized protein
LPRFLPALLLVLCVAGTAGVARAACPDPVPEDEWSVLMPLAATSLKLAVVRVGDDFIAVGDRGHVLVSEDQGRSWRQMRTPTRALLTGSHFHDRNLGWVVGHDAVILRTEDGGDTWCRTHFAPELEFPLFDVWFADELNGIAVGAYGYFLRSSDGGMTWQEETLALVEDDADEDANGDEALDDGAADDDMDDDDWGDDFWLDDGLAADLHMNRIVSDAEGRLYLMAEAGTVFRSDDQGMTWHALELPYDGSLFGGVAPDERSLLVFGLRGNTFRTWDGGESWRRVSVPVDTSLFGGARTADGGVIVVGMAGVMLISREGDRFRLVQRGDRAALVSAIATDDGALIVVGEPGVQRVEPEALAGGRP